ncbi:hypothetical protein [Kitasatospora phosalacinea]|uniref:Uncharacterized protein n=1 Tax=Kitasatospora phosalacinea TaxID=2065 RepID=A0A9W6PEV2_9ACTN|nr:hypothetical protein [Kitasatospora phosalacinea]GLW54695.1 hypothetical protein Kpho01_27060 [Kitasatospora phosalacinea]
MASRRHARQDGAAPKNPPESMQHHLRQRLNSHARERWPQVNAVTIRFRAGFAYAAAESPGGQSLPLCRLPFTGVLHTWGVALYLADSDGRVAVYEGCFLGDATTQQAALHSVGWRPVGPEAFHDLMVKLAASSS